VKATISRDALHRAGRFGKALVAGREEAGGAGAAKGNGGATIGRPEMEEPQDRIPGGSPGAPAGARSPEPSGERRHGWSRVRLFLRFAAMRSTALRAVKVACVITPILTLLNHSREILALELGLRFWTQVALTFFVPYGVSTYSSAMAAIAEQHRMGHDPNAPLPLERGRRS
jgi:hypothetical protein